MALADVRILTHKFIGIKSCKSPVTKGAHADYRDGRDKPAMTPSYKKATRRYGWPFSFGRDLPRARKRRRKLPLMRLGLRFRGAVRLGWPVAAFRHKLVELRLVFCMPQPVKEITEFALLLLKPA